MSNRLAVTGLVVGLVGGGLAGLALGISQTAGAATTPTTPPPAAASPATPSTPTAPSSTPFKSNEDPTHEKGESAAREAAENSGQIPAGGGHFAGGNGHSNEDPAHEKTESAARESQENAGPTAQAPAAQSPATQAPSSTTNPAG